MRERIAVRSGKRWGAAEPEKDRATRRVKPLRPREVPCGLHRRPRRSSTPGQGRGRWKRSRRRRCFRWLANRRVLSALPVASRSSTMADQGNEGRASQVPPADVSFPPAVFRSRIPPAAGTPPPALKEDDRAHVCPAVASSPRRTRHPPHQPAAHRAGAAVRDAAPAAGRDLGRWCRAGRDYLARYGSARVRVDL